VVQAHLGHLKAKRGGTEVQVVQCLPNKHEALHSNPSTTRRKKEKSRKISGLELGEHLTQTGNAEKGRV
jgi:hypothetical protein